MKIMVTFLLFCFGLASSVSYSATCTALSNGNWSSPGTWSCGSVPSCGDLIVIPADVIVQVDMMVNLDESSMPACNTPVQIIVYGTMSFQTGRKMYLSCGSTVEIMVGGQMRHGTGGGASNTLDICGTEVWRSADGHVNGYRLFGTPIPLPTTLVQFDAYAESAQLYCSWTVESERLVDRYLLEVSPDNAQWMQIGHIPSIGDHTEIHAYSSVNDLHLPGAKYVRLIVRDIDGKEEVLETRTFENRDALAIYPNPVNQTEDIYLQDIPTGSVHVFDLSGLRIATLPIESGRVALSSVHLQPALYIIQDSETGKTHRLMIR